MAQQKVRILSDATMDLPAEIVEELDIGILPTQIMIEDREKPYRNYIDITPEEFWEKLVKCKEIPTTSVPRQGDILKVYEESLEKYESLIVFGHSSKISSSYFLAKRIAEEMFPGKDITVIDSRTITIMEGLLVYEAAIMARNNATKEDIISHVNDLIPHTHGIAVLKSLDHLKKGGRINIAKYLIGSLANFKPLIGVEDGLVQNIGTVRGYDNAIELIKKNIPNILNGRKTEFIAILHALMPNEANELKEFINKQENAPKKCDVFLIGPVLGTHMGPYAVGLGWIGDWDTNWWKK
ncbi:MAG TPA: DegV family protein [candidate division Zixibacteria bacterium]|nr:DegV family protein [candidate division Zixibacteria bacterium]